MPQIKPMKAAVLGSGRISKVYIPTIQKYFHCLEIVGTWDPKPERAAENEKLFGVRAMQKEEIMADPSIEVILNLSKPHMHYALSKEAMEHGKHVYSEKMLAGSLEEARELLTLAQTRGRKLTCAPDTFLGGGWQTARKMIDDGVIGKPLFVQAAVVRSYQLVDPNMDKESMAMSYGIPFDMGGYYLHAMINLFGSISRVGGFSKVDQPERAFLNPRNPRYGEKITMDSRSINTMAATLEFESGVYGTLLITSQSQMIYQSSFTVYGTQGTLELFDPNFYSGSIRLKRTKFSEVPMEGMTEYMPVPVLYGYTEETRGIGAADMVYAIRNGRKPRADASINYHALEAIEGILTSQRSGVLYEMKSRAERPAPLKSGILRGTAQEHFLDD